MRCLPPSRGVPTSFYYLIAMFLANRGTPQYYSPFNQIKAVAHIHSRHIQETVPSGHATACELEDHRLSTVGKSQYLGGGLNPSEKY